MRALITGASGFIGKNLMPSLPTEWDVYITGHQAINGNLLAAFPRHFDACIYLAGNGDPNRSCEDPVYDLAGNSGTLLNLFSSGMAFDKFIYFSSGAVYLDPPIPYSISKRASEQYLRYFKVQGRIKDLTTVRFFGAYGPFEPERKIYTRLVRRFGIEKNPKFTIRGDGSNLIDAMYVGDTIAAIHLLLDNHLDADIVDLSSKYPMTITDLVMRAGKAFGIVPDISYEGEVAEPIDFKSHDFTLERDLGFRPAVSLEDGLRHLCNYIKNK